MLITLLLVALILLILSLIHTRPRTHTTIHWAHPVERRHPGPEYRDPPVRTWKPPRYQQMGVLTNDEGKILPLYGKETNGHRNRYHYHTVTPGNQAYALPVMSGDGRDCQDDIGCEELYGKEDLRVVGIDGNFKPHLYKYV